MLTAIAFVPSAPVVVPQISGPVAHDVEPLREATLTVAARLGETADTWLTIGMGASPDAGRVPEVGSFMDFGVRLEVTLVPGRDQISSVDGRDESAEPEPEPEPEPEAMPTSMLVAAWLRGRCAPHAGIHPLLAPVATTPAQCVQMAQNAVSVVNGDDPIGVLVVADGSIGLTHRAPGGLIPEAADIQAEVDSALSGGDLDALDALDEKRCARARVDGRAAWQVAAQIWRRSTVTRPAVDTLYTAAPFGVGYHVGWWSR